MSFYETIGIFSVVWLELPKYDKLEEVVGKS